MMHRTSQRRLTGGDLPTARWRKSSRSDQSGGACVEVAQVDHSHVTRDSKDPIGPVLAFTGFEWGAFLAEVKAGTHDLS
ncbi:DUF397 domain-containing protein [Spirillospora sp. NPDC052269]